MIIAESTIIQNINTGRVDRQFRYFKVEAFQVHKIEGTDRTPRQSIEIEEFIVFTDQSTSYVNIADYLTIHISKNKINRLLKRL
jgi:hypothetical protein